LTYLKKKNFVDLLVLIFLFFRPKKLISGQEDVQNKEKRLNLFGLRILLKIQMQLKIQKIKRLTSPTVQQGVFVWKHTVPELDADPVYTAVCLLHNIVAPYPQHTEPRSQNEFSTRTRTQTRTQTWTRTAIVYSTSALYENRFIKICRTDWKMK
jgi:hypothetical protein